jgi:hypothetical protein
MADGFQPKPRKKIALDNNKLSMRAPNSKGKMAGLNWMLVKNNPRLVVYTNDPEDTTDYGKITAALDAPTFFAFVQLLRQAIAAEGKFREKIDNSNFTFPGGKRSETPSVVSSLIVGRDEDGLIWISVSAPRRPQIKFHFINPDFHNFLHNDGTPYTKAECSVLYAKSYATLLELVMAHLLVSEYVAPEPKPDQGGNRGGYGGNRGGGGGGNSGGSAPKADDFGDDVGW